MYPEFRKNTLSDFKLNVAHYPIVEMIWILRQPLTDDPYYGKKKGDYVVGGKRKALLTTFSHTQRVI